MPEKRYRVRLVLKDLRSLKGMDVDIHCMPMREREDGLIEAEAIVGESMLARLRRRRKEEFSVEVLADRTQEALETRKLTSQTNRYADGSLPIGPGTKGRQRVP